MLLPVLGALASGVGGETAIDAFSGTTRVAQEFKSRGYHVTAVDSARYSRVLGECYVATDLHSIGPQELHQALQYLDNLPGIDGYVTETFCRQSRFFQPFNGARIDAIREALEREFTDSPLYPVLLTSLMEAADRVDSTTGLHMAYVKEWAPRSFNSLELRAPQLLPGGGTVVQGNILDVVGELPEADVAYLDPPYNQHSYYANYHIWETLVAWDKPGYYGVACKRSDVRDAANKSPFNRKREIHGALRQVIEKMPARLLLISFSNEGWVSLEDIMDMCKDRGYLEVLSFDHKRYVGAQIGIHNPSGDKVGRVSHLRNMEHVIVVGDEPDVREAVKGYEHASQDRLF